MNRVDSPIAAMNLMGFSQGFVAHNMGIKKETAPWKAIYIRFKIYKYLSYLPILFSQTIGK